MDGRNGTTAVAITAEQVAKIERRRQQKDSIDNLPVMMEGLSQLVFGVQKLRKEQKAAILRCAVPQFNDSNYSSLHGPAVGRAMSPERWV